jgi:glycosyltransferase involved in cell wall biosynthesis
MSAHTGDHNNIDRPLISVIMPCYNAEPYLREAVDSVLNQTHPNIELIVVDDGSTDRSRDILAEYGKRIKVLHQANQGPYPARNFGASHATGAFIAFLDADDWWSLDCMEKLHAALEAAPSAAVAYCGWQNVGVAGGRGDPYVPPDYELEDKAVRFLRAAAPWPIHAALVRREVFDEVGGFDVNIATCMDYDLWLRIAVARTIVLVPEVLAFYRHHKSGQITSTQWRQARNTWLVKRKFLHDHPHLVAHLTPKQIRELIEGALLKRGYDNFWRRDLVSAQHIFRMSLVKGGWKLKDLAYLLPALLPTGLYQRLIGSRDR